MRVDLAEITPERIAAARAAAPLAFGGPIEARLRSAAIWAVLALLTAYCLARFDFSRAKNVFRFSLGRFFVRRGMDFLRGGALKIIRFGFVPQVLPMFLSSALYMFESNVRSATILGIVGAGGIGYHLAERIRSHRWEEACLILIMILVTVAVIDFISKHLRQRLIGKTRH